MNRCDCLCVGIVVADFICEPVPRLPHAGELVTTDRISLAIGGCASNVAVDLCRLGRSAAIVGCVGDDGPGRLVCDMLAEAGVDTAHLTRTAQSATSGTLIVNVRGEDRRFIHARGANALFEAEWISDEMLHRSRAIYLGGFGLMPRLDGARAAELFRRARAAGVPTVLDVVLPDTSDHWRELAQVLPVTDVFVPNVAEGAALTGLDDPLRQAERFVAAGAKVVIVTCGAAGAVLVSGSQRLRSRPYAVESVDGTGSGDAFAAGYIHALLDGAPPERCLAVGSALGASCVRSSGATAGVFTREELEVFLARNPPNIQPLA